MPRALRWIAGAALTLATVAAAAVAGVTVTMSDSFPHTSRARNWPAARAVPPGTIVVAVTAGVTGSVISDALLPYEAFARSPKFFVYTVAARRVPLALSGGLPFVPEHTFADAPPPDVVVVPAVADPTGRDEAPLRGWMTSQAQRGAYVLGVCSGAKVLAASGLLDGRRATSFWHDLPGLRASRPAVSWVAGQRYVRDGRIVTTAGVTSGLAGALHLIGELAGRGDADRIGRALAYPGWSLDGPTAIPGRRLAFGDLPYALNAAYPWWRPRAGVGLADGVGEIDVAAVFEVYAGSSSATRLVPLAAGDTVTTRPADGAAPAVDRLIVPGGPPSEALTGWAAARGAPVTVPPAGGFPFDAALRDLAAHGDRATARTTAKFIEYPDAQLHLTGAAWPWRPTLLGTAILAAAVAAGLAAARVRRRHGFADQP